ncbi:NtrZ family periplasmic regulatory protein [Phenylobacterium sp.]|uniref:NtrZ family periplasmic regulatory protein n=1 Tax=Phenylobacterium sp. TaxID=1871053 RepID=UPI0035613C58
MSVRRFALLIATTAALAAAGGVAQAADAAKTKPMDFTVRAEPTAVASGAQTLKWDAAKGRWGVMFNLQQPDTRETTLNDIQAGAYYKITPSLRVGGAVALGEQQIVPGPKPNTPDSSQPRVQFETKFKF